MEYRLGLYEKAMPAGLSWEQMLSSARDAGFDYLEISIDESEARLSRLERIRELSAQLHAAMRDTGMPVCTMCLSGHRAYPLGSHDAAVRARGMEIMRKAIQLAAELGVRIIQLAGYDVYYEQGDDETRANFAQNLHEAVEYAARYGVCMGFETMETAFLDTVEKGMRHVLREQSPYLGMYPDLGNLNNAALLYNHALDNDLRCGRGHLFAMHLKETKPGLYRDMSFGEGVVDFASGIRTAKELGVRMFTAECWHDGREAWQENLASISRFLRRELDRA